jgi:hypothetical protein
MFPNFSKFGLDANTPQSFRSTNATCAGETLWARVEGVSTEAPFGGAPAGKVALNQSDVLVKTSETRVDESLLERLQSLFRKAA